MTEWELSGSGRRRLRLPLPNSRASRRAGEGSLLDGFGASRDSGTAAATPSTAAATAATAGHGSPTVLFVLPYTEPAGTERHVLTLARELLRRGWRVGLAAPPGDLLADFLAEGIPHYAFPRLEQRPIQGIRAFRRALAQAIEQALAGTGGAAGRAREEAAELEPPARERPPVLIHVHGAHELVLLSRTVAAARRLPVVFTVHGYFSRQPDLDYRLASWIGNRFADRVICVSHSEHDCLTAAGLRDSKLRLIHNGVDDIDRGGDLRQPVGNQRPALARQDCGLDPTAVIVGAVGRLERQKGFRYLIEASSELMQGHIPQASNGPDPSTAPEPAAARGQAPADSPDHDPDRARLATCIPSPIVAAPLPRVQLAIVGSGQEEDSLRQLASLRGLVEGRDVVFLGYRKDARLVMRLFDILALPSLEEAFPLTLLEAMAAGLPVVATSVGGVPEMVTDGATGILVRPGDSHQLAQSLHLLVTDPERRRSMGLSGRRRYETHFTVQAMADKTIALYRELSSRPATSPDQGS